jgi:hypothetical protein
MAVTVMIHHPNRIRIACSQSDAGGQSDGAPEPEPGIDSSTSSCISSYLELEVQNQPASESANILICVKLTESNLQCYPEPG